MEDLFSIVSDETLLANACVVCVCNAVSGCVCVCVCILVCACEWV